MYQLCFPDGTSHARHHLHQTEALVDAHVLAREPVGTHHPGDMGAHDPEIDETHIDLHRYRDLDRQCDRDPTPVPARPHAEEVGEQIAHDHVDAEAPATAATVTAVGAGVAAQ